MTQQQQRRGAVALSCALWGIVATMGCTPAPIDDGCQVNTTQACLCVGGGEGVQACRADGAWESCVCAAADGSGTDATTAQDSEAADTADADGSGSDATTAPDSKAADTADAGSTQPSCSSDKDCKAEGKVCDPLTKACVACLTDVECGPSEHCVALACQGYTACSNSLGCKDAKGPDGNAQPICDQTIGECSACLTSADCPASHDCKHKLCVPFSSCKNSTDCSSDEVCDKSAGRCVQCLGDNDCDVSELCESGVCNAFVACTSDKQCTQLGLLCDATKGKCSQCLQHSDCPDIYNCQNVGVAKTGVCVLDVCAQGQGACNSGAKVTCNAVGDGYGSPQSCPTASTCVAPGGKPECKPWACTPGSSCEGDKAISCSDDGLEVVQSLDCAAAGQKCLGGECKSLLCEPASTYCDGKTVKQCSLDGLSATEVKACGGSEYCEAGVCKAQVCTPGAQGCDGDVAAKCNAVGSAYEAGGVDCKASGKVCSGGACQALLCAPSKAYCDGKTVKQCSLDGLSATEVKACGGSEYCETGVCKAQVCTPGAQGCYGDVAAKCNAVGSAFEAGGVDCKASGKVCTAGACQALLCEPASTYCDGKMVKLCSIDGLSATEIKACGGSEYCEAGVCKAQLCTPGAQGCSGDVAAKCNAVGSAYEAGGVDCKASGKVCSGGACLALLCAPSKAYCVGNLVKQCAADGLSATPGETCTAADSCSTVACVQGACATTATAKDETSCSQDGSKWCKAGKCVSKSVWNGISWTEIFYDSLAGPSLPAGTKVMDSCCGHAFASFDGKKGFKQKSDWNVTYIPVTRSTTTWEAVEASVSFPANQKYVRLCPLGEHYGYNGNNNFVCPVYSQAEQKIGFYIGGWTNGVNATSGTKTVLVKNASIAPDQWHSIRIEYSISLGRLRWLVDGVVLQETGVQGADELELGSKSKKSITLWTNNTCSCATGAIWSNLRVYSGN